MPRTLEGELRARTEVREIPRGVRYTVREEPFGFTLYDRKPLNAKFIRKDKQDEVFASSGVTLQECVFLPARRKDFRNDILYSPYRIYYELTLACNLRCKLCFNTAGKPKQNELSTEEVFGSLDSLREANVIDLRFTGGELTMRPDWFDIMKYAKKLGFVISCNTNAIFNQEEGIPEKFAALGLDQVTVSIDGNREHHDKNRGKGSFDQTLKNVQRMHDLGVRLRINTLLTKYSLNDYEFILELARLYTDEVNFFVPVFIGRGANREDEFSVTNEESAAFSKKIEELRPKYSGLNVLHFMRSTKSRSLNSRTDSLGLQAGPPSGFTTFNLTCDGGIWGGGYVPYIDGSWCLGNIKKDNIFDIWQRSELLEKQRKQSQALRNFCGKCPVYGTSCAETKWEIELNRQLHPESNNFYCIYGQGKPLLDIVE